MGLVAGLVIQNKDWGSSESSAANVLASLCYGESNEWPSEYFGLLIIHRVKAN